MRLTPLVVLALLVAGCAKEPAAQPDEGFDDAAPQGTLQGVVVDDAIRPLGNVTVWLDGTDPQRNMTTGDDGVFRFDALAAGAYLVRASRTGYFETQVAATVLEEGTSDGLRLVLSADVATTPLFQAYVFEGFLQCSVAAVAARAACNSDQALSPLCALPVGLCDIGPQNLTEDKFMALHTFSRGDLSFLQSEMQWKDTTNGFGENLRAIPGARSPGDGKIGDYRPFEGPSPLIMTMPGDLANGLLLGAGRDYIVRVFTSHMDGTAPPCLPPPVNCQWGVGAVVNQEFKVFTHAFYNMLPPPGWQFGLNGDPDLPQP